MPRLSKKKTSFSDRVNTLRSDLHRLSSHAAPIVRRLSFIFRIASFIMSVATLVSLILLIGFDYDASSTVMIRRLLRAAQCVFIVTILFDLIFDFKTVRKSPKFAWIVRGLMLLTLIPLLYPRPIDPWLPWLDKILYSHILTFGAMTLFAIVSFSFGVTKMMGKHTNPSIILAVSFLFFIIVGSFLLMMPKCIYHPISYIDSLFVATSAVSITGLTPIDISATFTPLGLLILAILIQIGGLGVLTFTSFFALFFSGSTSVYSQLMVKDMVYTRTMNSLLPTLLYILGFTVIIELIGAVLIFLSVHGTLNMSLEDELIFSGFHALTAFCNAGFSNIEGGLSNPVFLNSNQSIYIIISILVLAGGIGFPILVNLKQAIARGARHIWNYITGRRRRSEPTHIYDVNTKIVLWTTLIIFAISSLLFFIFEYDNSMKDMTLYEKIVQSVFNSFVPRSSGFSSISPDGFLNITLIMMVVLMWIGGASQSTAGGIKVNTFAASLLNVRSVITGRKDVTVFHRRLSVGSLRRANAVIFLSIVFTAGYIMTMVLLEPGLPLKGVIFETVSALFTVGSSLGITPELSVAGKIVLCTAMFIGRVGILSLLIGFASHTKYNPAEYPTGSVIIN